MDEASRVFEYTGEIFKVINLEKQESKVVYEDPQAPKTYSIATVTAVVLAVCLAHFLLTVGGFTGEKGYDKLIAAEEWLSRKLSS
jgi:heme oxygenase